MRLVKRMVGCLVAAACLLVIKNQSFYYTLSLWAGTATDMYSKSKKRNIVITGYCTDPIMGSVQ